MIDRKVQLQNCYYNEMYVLYSFLSMLDQYNILYVQITVGYKELTATGKKICSRVQTVITCMFPRKGFKGTVALDGFLS